MSTQKYTFSKNERVKSTKEMSRIFKDGIFFYSEYISMGFVKAFDENQKQHKIAISVPKKKIKLAVRRNKVKRLIREAYRLNKHILYKNKNGTSDFYSIIFIYRFKEILKYKTLEDNIVKLLSKLEEKSD